MAEFVVDVSACIPWCCSDEATAASEELLRRAGAGDILHVPGLWVWEIVNAVSVAERRRRIDKAQAEEFLKLLGDFSFRVAATPKTNELSAIRDLAGLHGLTAYDAAYLDLAKRLGLPLATLDADLIRAARAEAVAVL